jgi:hypothetical protein
MVEEEGEIIENSVRRRFTIEVFPEKQRMSSKSCEIFGLNWRVNLVKQSSKSSYGVFLGYESKSN